MSDAGTWHACTRCFYKDGEVCLHCGRPKNAGKGWRPPVSTALAMTVELETESLPVRDVQPITIGDGSPHSSALPAPMTLLAHSPIGGSAVERYSACSASVELIRLLKQQEAPASEEEDWTTEGTKAHELLASCLEANCNTWDVAGTEGWEHLDIHMAQHVQACVEHVRELGGRLRCEYPIHRPEIDPDFYSRLDVCIDWPLQQRVRIIDFKYGQGVFVPVVANKQLMYYAAGVIEEDPAGYPDDTVVELEIMQPRAIGTEGAFRLWTTTAGEIRRWLHESLIPAMLATKTVSGWFYDMGEHCRFCVAKIACPAMNNMRERVTVHGIGSEEECQLLTMLIKAWRADAFARLSAGQKPEEVGAKLVYGKANRVWNNGAEEALVAQFGVSAYKTELLSPAGVEKLPEGEQFAAQWAYSPDGKPTIAPLNDPRTTVMTDTASTFGSHVAKALALAQQA